MKVFYYQHRRNEKIRIRKEFNDYNKNESDIDDEIVDEYNAMLEEANELVSICMSLSKSPDKKGTDECMERLFSFQNVMREFAGIDKLSTDLMRAFRSEY